MTDFRTFSEADLEEWRQHPVSLFIKEALRESFRQQVGSAQQAYWAGNPWPEAERLALLRMQALSEDMFESSLDDLMAAMEQHDESERDIAG